jgi:DNA-binding transcriptional regulator YhcF (GntR family)
MDMVTLDPESSLPPFEQVRTQIGAAIEGGTLAPAVRLPTVRQLADRLGLATNTVARAYRELELAGLVETRGRNGTFVAGAPSPEREAAVAEVKRFIDRMHGLGIGDIEALALVRREIGLG